MAEAEFCQVERAGAVLWITIDRPAVMNALHGPAHAALSGAFDRFAADPALQVAVLTGAGARAFCCGADLKAFRETGSDEIPQTGFGGLTARFDLEKPVIAMVNGAALGGGFELALACDLVIAAAHAIFGFPEPKVGQAALGGGGVQRLVRQIPLKPAMGLLLTGHSIDAPTAQAWGLVNAVVPAADLRATTERWVADVLDCAPLAVRASKAIAMTSLDCADLEEAIRRPHPTAARMRASADAEEGLAAFAEKRKPQWQGR